MKTIYEPVLSRLQPLIDEGRLRWLDLDRGQLKQKAGDRYAIAFPAAFISINIIRAVDLTDQIQDCTASVTVTLAFDPQSYGRTAANAPAEIREQGLDPYDIIDAVFASLQGFGTHGFDSLSRNSQSEVPHNELFVYRLVFQTQFEDSSATLPPVPELLVTDDNETTTFIQTEK